MAGSITHPGFTPCPRPLPKLACSILFAVTLFAMSIGGAEEWKPVRIQLESTSDIVQVMGVRGMLQRRTLDTLEGEIPVGAWIYYFANRVDHVSSLRRAYYFQYRGEPELKLSSDGQFARIQRVPGTPPTVFGMSLRPTGNLKQTLEDLEKIKGQIDEGLSVTLENDAALKILADEGIPITAIFIDGKSERILDLAEIIAEVKPKFLRTAIEGEELELLGLIPSLQGLELRSAYQAKNETDWSRLASLKGLENLETLRLYISRGAFSLGDLEGLKSLRWLDVFGKEPADPTLPVFPRLESLRLEGGGRYDPESISKMLELRRLSLGIESLGADLKPLEPLKNLRLLDLVDYSPDPSTRQALDRAAFDRLAESGNFSELRFLEIGAAVGFQHLPALERLFLYPKEPGTIDLGRLAETSGLFGLNLGQADQSDLETLISLDSLRDLRRLTLEDGTFTDPGILSAFPNLENLQIMTNRALSGEVDLRELPSLKTVTFRSTGLKRIAGFADHPSLEQFYLAYNPSLVSLGEPARNEKVRTIYIYGCPRLTDFKALTGLYGLKWLAWHDNGTNQEPLPLPPNREILYEYTDLE